MSSGQPQIHLFDENLKDHNRNQAQCFPDYTKLSVLFAKSDLKIAGFNASSDSPSSTLYNYDDNSILKCEGSIPIVQRPNGLKYYFEYGFESYIDDGKKKKVYTPYKVEDHFGNWITFDNHFPATSPYTSITYDERSDGQRIYKKTRPYTFPDGDTGSIYEVSANNRVFKYYKNEIGLVEKIIDPIGRETVFEYGSGTGLNNVILKITTPQKLVAEYHYAPEFDNGGLRLINPDNPLGIDLGFTSGRLTGKTISGPGIEPREWLYYQGGSSRGSVKFISIEYNKDGETDVVDEYRFASALEKNGLLLSFKRYAGTFPQNHNQNIDYSNFPVIYSEETSYSQINTADYGCDIEGSTAANSVFFNCERYRPTLKTTTVKKSDGIDSYFEKYEDYDSYGNARKVTLYSSAQINKKRHIKYQFLNDKINWLIGLPRKTSISTDGVSYKLAEEVTYHSASSSYKSKPNCIYDVGIRKSCNLSFHGTGDLKKKELENSSRWVEFSDYKRGVAQTIKVPFASGSSTQTSELVVDNNGWVTKTTDFEGNCYSQGYNDLGWIVSEVSCDSYYLPEVHTYGYVGGSEQSGPVKAGMYKETKTVGNKEEKKFIDALGRNVLLSIRDTNDSSTNRYKSFEYDKNSKLTFESNWSKDPSTQYGTEFENDFIGRVETNTDTANDAKTTFDYLSGDIEIITDPRGFDTEIRYLTYGKPFSNRIVETKSPENVTTTIELNEFDSITSVSQGGIEEKRVYNTNGLLCKIVRPDVGNTAFSYNDLGEVYWSAASTSVDSELSCDSSVTFSHKVFYTYDNHGKITWVNYKDSTPDINYTYDKNDRVKSVTSDGVATYVNYNSVNLISSESARYKNYTIRHHYDYDSLMNIKSMTYSNGETVTFDPNALGQQNSAGNYASDIKYHPNGQIASFNYGNGFEFSSSLDNSNRIQYLQDVRTSDVVASNYFFKYDKSGNLEKITDYRSSLYNLSLRYDGLNRLRFIDDSFMGNGSLTYDGMNNIKSYRLGNASFTYNYSSNKKLESITGSIQRSFGYDDRGNIISDGEKSLSFSRDNRPRNITRGTSSKNFVYDGNGNRAQKNSTNSFTRFFYSQSGKLLYTFNEKGVGENYIYIGNKLIAKNRHDVLSSAMNCNTPCVGRAIIKDPKEKAKVTINNSFNCPSGNCSVTWHRDGGIALLSTPIKTNSAITIERVCSQGVPTALTGNVWAVVKDNTTSNQISSFKQTVTLYCESIIVVGPGNPGNES